MHKNFLPASLIITASSLLLAAPTQAAEYTTPIFPTDRYPISHLSWILTGTTDVNSVNLEYQTTADRDQTSSWQTVSDFTCEPEDDTLTCRTQFSPVLDAYVALRLTYPDSSVLQTFNLTLSSDDTETPEPDHDQIYYSAFKTLDPTLTATTLSWREQELTSPVTDRIVFQTRATYDDTTWSNWSGNAEFLTASDLGTGLTTIATTGQVDLDGEHDIDYDGIIVTYLDEDHPYTLTAPAVTGATEADAFANLTLTLDTIDHLHLGDTIELTQVIGAETYRLRGLISDIKATVNQISVFSWAGAIPSLSPSLCGDEFTFCYTPDATVHRLATAIFPAPEEDSVTHITLPIYTDAEHTATISYVPQLEDVSFYRIREPSCLEYTDTSDQASDSATLATTCRTKGISLSHYYTSSQQPTSLQYRIIYGFVGDVAVTDVFLHQDTPTDQAPAGNIMTDGAHRLRGGKVFQSGNSRPYYWH